MEPPGGSDEGLPERPVRCAAGHLQVLAEVVPPGAAVVAGRIDEVGLQQDPIARREPLNPVPDRVHHARRLMTGDHREVDEGMVARERVEVGSTDPDGLAADAQLAGARLRS
jgi:hypothetical protein